MGRFGASLLGDRTATPGWGVDWLGCGFGFGCFGRIRVRNECAVSSDDGLFCHSLAPTPTSFPCMATSVSGLRVSGAQPADGAGYFELGGRGALEFIVLVAEPCKRVFMALAIGHIAFFSTPFCGDLSVV